MHVRFTPLTRVLQLSVPAEARQVAYYFLADIIDGQSEYLTDIQRALFYQSVANKGSLGMTDLYPRIRFDIYLSYSFWRINKKHFFFGVESSASLQRRAAKWRPWTRAFVACF